MLAGDLVRLRPLDVADAEAHLRWNNYPEVVQWMSTGYPNTLDQFVTGYADRYRNSYEKLVLGIEIISAAQFIGLVALTGAEAETGGAELDLYIGEKDRWGKGYGTEATRLICRYGFGTTRLHRIQLGWPTRTGPPSGCTRRLVSSRRAGRATRSARAASGTTWSS
jgi:RimJ/RimL family protein N-acetyltransferase